MASDVVQKVIQANTIKQGIAVVSVQRNGAQVTEETYVESRVSLAEIDANLSTRFDDPTYYSS
jgi:hypothetical protein